MPEMNSLQHSVIIIEASCCGLQFETTTKKQNKQKQNILEEQQEDIHLLYTVSRTKIDLTRSLTSQTYV